MKRRKNILLVAVFWILGGMVFNGYHQHRESEKSRLTQACSVCKIQNQNTAAPAKEVGAHCNAPLLSQEKVILSYLTPHRLSIRWGASPRDPPSGSC